MCFEGEDHLLTLRHPTLAIHLKICKPAPSKQEPLALCDEMAACRLFPELRSAEVGLLQSNPSAALERTSRLIEAIRRLGEPQEPDANHFPASKTTHDESHCLNMDTSTEAVALQDHFRNFIDGSHILHYHNVLDAFGHLSIRHPMQPGVFFMSHSIAPGNIASSQDLIAYYVEDAEPVNTSATKGYAERRIHSEIYKRHPHIHAAVHSHSEAVVPYSIARVPLRACYHMAAFIGASGAPVFDIGDHYRGDDVPDMLVRSEHTGAALAKCFDDGEAVALMRGHGFTVVAESLELAVLRAIYTQKNATIQTSAMLMHFASGGSSQQVKYLSELESEAADATIKWAARRPWELWVREVKACGLYSNSA